MGKNKEPGFCFEVFSLNQRRLSALRELRITMDAIAEDEKKLEGRLFAVASPEARQFLGETTIIDDLFAYGFADRKIDVKEYPGMGTVASIKRVLAGLRDVWQNAISVEFNRGEGGRVEVEFRAIGF